MKKVYIAAAKRTAIGNFNGTLSAMPAADFASVVVKDILDTAGLAPEAVDEVIVGCVLPAGAGQGIGRQVSLGAGIPDTVPAYALNMVCGSGLKAAAIAYAGIQAQDGEVYVVGGAENMSMTPYLLPEARQGLRMGNKQILDYLVFDALTDAYNNYHMGVTAENIAEKYGITREEQDRFALSSQEKAAAAIEAGAFKAEITPVTVKTRKEEIVFDRDEYPRRTDIEKLRALKPAFKKDGTVTAGNASGINDGAAFLLVASEDALKKHNLTPMAEIVAAGQGGVDPKIMGMGPVPAIRDALGKSGGLGFKDIDVIELNEAFAAQSLGVIRELANEHGVTEDYILGRANLNGGAIALGHPVGASGARILVTLIHIMKAQNARYGLGSLCIGGGMGAALIVRNV